MMLENVTEFVHMTLSSWCWKSQFAAGNFEQSSTNLKTSDLHPSVSDFIISKQYKNWIFQ